jgi:tetratricopeptide (TPR) repeat protein
MTAWPSSRVSVFVSSTIGECAPERAAAKRAIESLNCDPILFENIGARPHPPRATYLEGLSRSQICVIIWKESYGYIDPSLGISGIEDEYRQAQQQERDILAYIKKSAPERDARLASLIADARTAVTTFSYEDETTLGDQIRADISSLISGAYIDRIASRADRLVDPSAVVTGILPAGETALSRPALEQALDRSIQHHPVSWLIGRAGSGKTITLALWAIRRHASYVNARGLSGRHLVRSMVAALSSGNIASDTATSLESGLATLRSVWRDDAKWPLVIDDPADPAELTSLLDDLGGSSARARVVVAVRAGSEPPSSATVEIPNLDAAEIAEIVNQLPGAVRQRVETTIATMDAVYPLDIRRAVAANVMPQQQIFDDVGAVNLDPQTRELLALIAASPEPLTLGDLRRLSSSEEQNPIAIDERLSAISYLIIDDGLGFRPVHDDITNDLRAALSKRPALHKFVSLRLAQFFARAKRHMAAFELYRHFDPDRALTSAYRAGSQAAVEGRLAHSIPPLEFIASAKRRAGERLDLGIVLLSLAQAYESMGNTTSSNSALIEAETIATQIDDKYMLQLVQDQRLIGRVRRELRPADLAALREVRARYKSEGRVADAARLAIEEGALLISIGDHQTSIPVLREARAVFLETDDAYGVYVATRNLIASLNMVEGGQNEAEQLLHSIEGQAEGLGQLRERAWMCNILARRYRLDGLLDDAVSVAQEAIDIGGRLGDPYVVALNRIGLGNALRAKGDLRAALESFKECGREAQLIKRNEMDGLASRLASEVLVQMTGDAAPYQRPALYSEAEVFASHVIGLLGESIVQDEVAEALDTRGDARIGLGKKAEALSDYAASAKLFTKLNDDRAVPVVRHLAVNLDYTGDAAIETMRVLLGTLPESIATAEATNPWLLLIALIHDSVQHGHRRAVGILVGAALRVAQTIMPPELEVGLWLRLLSLARESINPPDDGRMSFALSAFLAHTRQRRLSMTQLSALTDLTIGNSEKVRFHSSTGGELQASVKLGQTDKVLLVFDDLDSNSATRFVAISLVSFFTGYRMEIDQEFLARPLQDGIYIRCNILDVAEAPADIREQLENAATDAPVVIVFFEPNAGRTHELIIVCRPDIQQRCQGDPLRATELQFMYADVLRAVLQLVLGGQIESELLRPKIVSLLRSTIH